MVAALALGVVAAGAPEARATELHPPAPLAELVPGVQSSIPQIGCASAGGVLFLAKPIAQQYANELYFTDGTAGGTTTELPHDLAGHYVSTTVAFDGCGDDSERVFFWVNDINPPGGPALLATDGTVQGTQLIHAPANPIDEIGGGVSPVVPGSRRLLFRVYGDTAGQLWSSDSTAAGTVELRKPDESSFEYAHSPVPYGLHSYFVDSPLGGPATFWKTDGTGPGTLQYATIAFADGEDLVPWQVRADGRLMIETTAGLDPDIVLLVTWSGEVRTLGAVGSANDVLYESFVNVGNVSYFFNRTASAVFVTDGTAAGTEPLFPLDPEPFGTAALAPVGADLYFESSNAGTGSELWKYDTLAGQLELVADICPGPCSSHPRIEPFSNGAIVGAFVDGTNDYGLFYLDTDGALSTRIGPFCDAPCPDLASPIGEIGTLILLGRGDSTPSSRLWTYDTGTDSVHQETFAPTRFLSIQPGESPVRNDTAFVWLDYPATGSEPWILEAVPDPCVPSAQTLCLGGDRFRIEVRWRDFIGQEGEGNAFPLTSDTGDFWFFDSTNVELMVKIVDGSGSNGHFWVYYGALSNVEYSITIDDTVTGRSKTYHNELGEFGSFGDIEAFPVGSGAASAAAPVEPTLPRVLPAAVNAPPHVDFSTDSGPCLADPTRVCLLDERFSVSVTWTDFAGRSGVGQAENLTSDTGYFWFFDPNVIEVVVKLVDGSATNGQFWVYYGSLSNVEFEITVTDRWTGVSRPYRNPLGSFGSFGDIEAFLAP